MEALGAAKATKTSLKRCSCAASNFIKLIPSRSVRQMLAHFQSGQSSGKETESLCLRSRPRQNVKLGPLRCT